jgi:hypothetical protein
LIDNHVGFIEPVNLKAPKRMIDLNMRITAFGSDKALEPSNIVLRERNS